MPAKRQRAKSMFIVPAVPSNNVDIKKFTMDDLNLEFTKKYKSHNRGLKPGPERQLREPPPQKMSECQKIYEEFKAKLQAKKMSK